MFTKKYGMSEIYKYFICKRKYFLQKIWRIRKLKTTILIIRVNIVALCDNFNRRNTYLMSKWRLNAMKIYEYQGKKNLCGKQVRECRRRQKMTQSELAARLQLCNVMLDQKAVSRIELQDRIVADYELWALARALRVEIGQLLHAEGKPEC